MSLNQEQIIEYWIKSAEYDLHVAEHLFEKKDYAYCLFIAHLVIEKMLKAYYVKNIDINPPYKHNLVLLANKSGLKIDSNQEALLDEASNFNIEARYPDIKFSFIKNVIMITAIIILLK